MKSRKRKTPKQYTGNSLKTLSRQKRAKTQLAEKGFLGVFEFLDLQKQTAAEKASNQAIDLTEEQSEKGSERSAQEEEESSDSSPEDGPDAVSVDVTAAAGTSANVTAAEVMSTNVTAANATIGGGSDLDAAPNLATATITTAATTKAPCAEIATAPNMAAAIANAPDVAAGGQSMENVHAAAPKTMALNLNRPDMTAGPGRSVDFDVEVEGVQVVAFNAVVAVAEEGMAEVEEVGEEDHLNGPGNDQVSISKVVSLDIEPGL